MSFSIRLAFVFCLLSLFIASLVQAQSEPQNPPSLTDAKTMADVLAYLNHEGGKLGQSLASLDPKERAATVAGILMPVSDKILEIAQTSEEKKQAYSLKFSALTGLVQTEVEGTEAKLDTFLKELTAQEEFKDFAEPLQLRSLAMLTQIKGIEVTGPQFETFIKELDAKEKTGARTEMINESRFYLFSEKAKKAEASPENFDKFKSELKGWIGNEDIPFPVVTSVGFEVAHRNKVSAEQIVKELTEYIQSPQCTLPTEGKKKLIEDLEMALRLAVGVDPKLYGKTLDDKDFDWGKLRGKYVLVKFTATWCGPCQMEIPGMLEAYKKYKDKGLEIVSVYMWERGDDPVAGIKKFVEEEKLPWIILAEELAIKAGQPKYSESYGIRGVPTMVLADKEGKIIMQEARGNELQAKLAEIFE